MNSYLLLFFLIIAEGDLFNAFTLVGGAYPTKQRCLTAKELLDSTLGAQMREVPHYVTDHAQCIELVAAKHPQNEVGSHDR